MSRYFKYPSIMVSEGADADRIIKVDERKFIDLKRSAIQFTKERVFIDHVLCEI